MRCPRIATVVGIPGKVVGSGGQRVPSQQLDQTSLPDPLIERIRQQVHDEIKRIEKTLRKEEDKGKGSRPAHRRRSAASTKRRTCWRKSSLENSDEVESAQKRAVRPQHVLREMPTRRTDLRNFEAALAAPGLALIAED